ncbi:MAG TPA: DUF1080 domain-containing protein [Phycisphaerae bacterium]|jgi:hypothetical protein|nr:DUF1080 domain-containing protein [Phycisphaerae bacterium]HRR84634.1 DUF1080 domain-containing protein [Phycisphaerae bacterium]
MQRYVKYFLLIGTLPLSAAIVLAAEGQKKEAGERQAKREDAAATQPAYLDKEHAPRGKGWIKLFNGKNLKGWKSIPENRPNSWKVENGILVSDFKEGEHGTNIFSEKKFGDFEIYYEYLVPKNGNSGVFLRGQYEIQIQADHGVPSDKPRDWGNGGIYGQKAPSRNVSKPDGEWQSVYATMIGKKITVFLNGEKIIDNYEPPRATHLYGELKIKDGDPTGPILLQGDHKPIKFRYVMIKPIGEPAEKK